MSVVTLLPNSTPLKRRMEVPLPVTLVPPRERSRSHKSTTSAKDASFRKSNSNSPVPNEGRISPQRPKNYRESAESSLNFKTVQRTDSEASEIVMTVAEVVVYEYHAANDTWERTSMEGTLFIYSRKTYPSHGLMVLNKLSSDNFVQRLTSDLPIHVQPPFVLFSQHGSSQVHGLCLPEEGLCEQVGQLITNVLDSQKNGPASLHKEPSQASPPESTKKQAVPGMEQTVHAFSVHATTASSSNGQDGLLCASHSVSPFLSSSHEGNVIQPSSSSVDLRRERAKLSRTSAGRRSSEPTGAAGKNQSMRSTSPKLTTPGSKTAPKTSAQASSRSRRAHKPSSQSQVRGSSVQSSVPKSSVEASPSASPSLARKLFPLNSADLETDEPDSQTSEATAPVLKSLFAQVSSSQSSSEGKPHLPPVISAADLERQMHMEVPSPNGQAGGVDFKYAGEDPTGVSVYGPVSTSAILTDASFAQPQLLQPSAFGSSSKTSGPEVSLVVQPPTPLSSQPTQPTFTLSSDTSRTFRPLVQVFPSIPPLVHSPGMTAAPKSSSKHMVECPVSKVAAGNGEQAEQRMASPVSGGSSSSSDGRAISPEQPLLHRTVQVSPAVGLMSPMQFTSVPKKSQSEPSGAHTIHSTAAMPTGGGAGGESKKVVGLTKSQMQQALLYLITHDESFMDTLHKAYVASLSASNTS